MEDIENIVAAFIARAAPAVGIGPGCNGGSASRRSGSTGQCNGRFLLRLSGALRIRLCRRGLGARDAMASADIAFGASAGLARAPVKDPGSLWPCRLNAHMRRYL